MEQLTELTRLLLSSTATSPPASLVALDIDKHVKFLLEDGQNSSPELGGGKWMEK